MVSARPPVKALLGGSPLVFNRFLYEPNEFITIIVIRYAMASVDHFGIDIASVLEISSLKRISYTLSRALSNSFSIAS